MKFPGPDPLCQTDIRPRARPPGTPTGVHSPARKGEGVPPNGLECVMGTWLRRCALKKAPEQGQGATGHKALRSLYPFAPKGHWGPQWGTNSRPPPGEGQGLTGKLHCHFESSWDEAPNLGSPHLPCQDSSHGSHDP